jgi:hypothetical protein
VAKVSKTEIPKDGDLVKALPRGAGRRRHIFGKLRVGKKGGYRINDIAVDRRGIQVLTGYEKSLLKVFLKTNGHCHFCGDELDFESRRRSKHPNAWEQDHFVAKRRGGADNVDNLLPACWQCNQLRWSRTGRGIRRRLVAGMLAIKDPEIAPRLAELIKKRDEALKRRRDRLKSLS